LRKVSRFNDRLIGSLNPFASVRKHSRMFTSLRNQSPMFADDFPTLRQKNISPRFTQIE